MGKGVESLLENIGVLGLVMLRWLYSHYLVIAFIQGFDLHLFYLSGYKNHTCQSYCNIFFILMQYILHNSLNCVYKNTFLGIKKYSAKAECFDLVKPFPSVK